MLYAVTTIVALCATAPSAREALDRWSASVQNIWSYDVTVHVNITTFAKDRGASVPVGDHRIRQRFLQKSWRVDLLETTWYRDMAEPDHWEATEQDILAYSYEYGTGKVRFFNSASNFGEVGSLTEFQKGKLLAPMHYELFRGDYYGQTFDQMLRPRLGETSVSSADGSVKLSIAPSPPSAPVLTNGKASLEVVLDPRKGYMPILIKRVPHPGKPHLIQVANEIVSVGDRLWAPRETVKTIYSALDTGDAGVPFSTVTLDVDPESALYNVDLSPLTFQLPFPPGTIVNDRDQRRNYVQTSDDERDYEAYDKLIRARVLEPGLEVGSAATKRSEQLSSSWVLLVSATCLLAMISVLVFYRLRRNRSRG